MDAMVSVLSPTPEDDAEVRVARTELLHLDVEALPMKHRLVNSSGSSSGQSSSCDCMRLNVLEQCLHQSKGTDSSPTPTVAESSAEAASD